MRPRRYTDYEVPQEICVLGEARVLADTMPPRLTPRGHLAGDDVRPLRKQIIPFAEVPVQMVFVSCSPTCRSAVADAVADCWLHGLLVASTDPTWVKPNYWTLCSGMGVRAGPNLASAPT